jgi:CubicO group peptidase (beta-lactamase class C family)
MHKFTVVFATLATATATTIAFAQPQEPAKTIESLMQAAHSIGVFNGNVLVAYKGKAIYEQSFGYADAARSRPLSADDLFYLGSITKEFNGAGILLLEQQGKLQLTDKVSRHLPGYPAWAENIEIKDLLNYTSGLPDIAGDTDAAMQDSILKIQKLAFPPGTAYLYSYANVFLQRRIIEKVSGVSYAAFVKKEILQPCHVAGGAEDSSKRLIAAPFTNALKPVAMNVAETPGDFLTARDLYNWATCLSGGKLLNEKSLEKLGIAFGSGESSLGAAQFESGKFRTHQHQGSGFNNEALLFTSADDETAVILLTNNQNFKLYQLKDAILAILHAQPYTVPKKSIYLDIREPLAADFQDGIATYLRLRESGKDTYDFAAEPFDLINTGRYLMRREKYDGAIAIFEISITFPLKPTDQSFAFALIAEAWSKKGNTPMARLYYEKALQLDPENKSAKGMLDQLTGR